MSEQKRKRGRPVGSGSVYEQRKIEDFVKGDVIQIDGINYPVSSAWESHGMHYLRYGASERWNAGTQMYAEKGAVYTARKRGV